MKQWDIQHTLFKVADFLTWQQNQQLDLSPAFQRRPVWEAGAKSFLIDTILRGLPVPPVIIRDLPPDLDKFRPRRQVVDGQQRLRTLISFIAPELLRDFDQKRDKFSIKRSHNSELSGAGFEDLSNDLRARILEYQFMVNVFPSNTDDRDILEIFARMNATGYKLTAQELRNARFFGEFKTLAFSLAAEHLEHWRGWQMFSETQIARMSEVELTSELLILILNGISEGNPATINRAYASHEEEFENANDVADRFRRVMDVIDGRFTPTQRIHFKNKTVFYPLFAALYNEMYGLKSVIRKSKLSKLSDEFIDHLITAASKIERGTAPMEILQITQRRVSQQGVRRRIAAYLAGKNLAQEK